MSVYFFYLRSHELVRQSQVVVKSHEGHSLKSHHDDLQFQQFNSDVNSESRRDRTTNGVRGRMAPERFWRVILGSVRERTAKRLWVNWNVQQNLCSFYCCWESVKWDGDLLLLPKNGGIDVSNGFDRLDERRLALKTKCEVSISLLILSGKKMLLS